MSDIDRIIATCRRDSRCVSGIERRALCDEIDRLLSVVNRIPHTSDGVPIVPGMRVWRREHVTTLGEEVWGITQGGVRLTHHSDPYASSDLFSTRESAEASTKRTAVSGGEP